MRLQILLKAAEQNWDEDRLTDFLTQRSVSPEHVQVFSTVWNKESEKVCLIPVHLIKQKFY